MVKLEVESIPNEILLKVFKFLDKKTLKDVSLTCKSWNLLASKAGHFLHLKHENHDLKEEDWSEALLECSRTFVRVKISDCDELESNNLLKIFQKHGQHVEELQMFNSSIDDAPIFIEILKTMPMIKSILLCNVQVIETYIDPEIVDNLPFSKLDTLEVINSNGHIFKCFMTSRLRTFKLCLGPERTEPAELLLDFLSIQKNLKTLALQGIDKNHTQLFKAPVDDEDIPFRLKKLSLLNFRLQEIPNDYNHLLKFLQIHTKTLHELEIGRIFPDFIFEFVFAKFHHLHRLVFADEGVPRDMNLYNRLEVNPSVTKLILRVGFRIPDNIFLSLLEHLPSIETFIAESCQFIDLLNSKEKTFPNIRKVAIDDLLDSSQLLTVFPNIEKLHVKNLSSNAIAALTGAESKIKELSFEYALKSENFFRDFVGDKLEVFRLGEIDVLNKEFFEKIRNNCKNLQTLKVLPASLVNVDPSDIAGIKALKFYQDVETEFFENFGRFWNDEMVRSVKASGDTSWTPIEYDLDLHHLYLQDLEVNDEGSSNESESSSSDED